MHAEPTHNKHPRLMLAAGLFAVCALATPHAATAAPALHGLEVYFPEVTLIEDGTVVTMTLPHPGEAGAVTAVRVQALIPQTARRHIRAIHVFADDLTAPRLGVFRYSADGSHAAVALRLRLAGASTIRAVAILNTGEHHLVRRVVPSRAVCPLPASAALPAPLITGRPPFPKQPPG